MSVLGVSNTLTQAAGLLVQALEVVVCVAATINDSLTVSSSAGAVTEAGDLLLIGDGIRVGDTAGAI